LQNSGISRDEIAKQDEIVKAELITCIYNTASPKINLLRIRRLLRELEGFFHGYPLVFYHPIDGGVFLQQLALSKFN